MALNKGFCPAPAVRRHSSVQAWELTAYPALRAPCKNRLTSAIALLRLARRANTTVPASLAPLMPS